MKWLNHLKEKWHAMTPVEKMKMVITGVCDLGADLMAGYICTKFIPEDTKKWKKAACIITMGGLGMKAGEVAAGQLHGFLDMLNNANPDREEDDG